MRSATKMIDLHISTNGRVAVFANWKLLFSGWPRSRQPAPSDPRQR